MCFIGWLPRSFRLQPALWGSADISVCLAEALRLPGTLSKSVLRSAAAPSEPSTYGLGTQPLIWSSRVVARNAAPLSLLARPLQAASACILQRPGGRLFLRFDSRRFPGTAED
jgi:hypothetical protein